MSTENYDVYKDQSSAKVITSKDLSRMAWRSLFLQASFNYERMQANGWLYTSRPSAPSKSPPWDRAAVSAMPSSG